jgi:hypothetical protein
MRRTGERYLPASPRRVASSVAFDKFFPQVEIAARRYLEPDHLFVLPRLLAHLPLLTADATREKHSG